MQIGMGYHQLGDTRCMHDTGLQQSLDRTASYRAELRIDVYLYADVPFYLRKPTR